MADLDQSSSLGLEKLDGKPEESPNYTAATQYTQQVQEGPGDLPQNSHQSPKVLRYKLEEPQVPATSRKMRQLLDGVKIINIYSCSSERQDTVIAKAESDLFEYFSGNVIDWANSNLGVCCDSVSIYLVDWMKAGGRLPTEGPSAVAYSKKNLEWLEQLYTIAGNLWMRKLMKQIAREIDLLNRDDKKKQSLAAERQKRESAIKEAIKREANASKEADRQKRWLARHLTDEQKKTMNFRYLDVHDERARLLVAETYQRETADRSLIKQQKEASKQMAKQRRNMEKALIEQFRRDNCAALMLRCKGIFRDVGYNALKLVGHSLLFGGMAAIKAAEILWFVAKIIRGLVSAAIGIPIFLVIRYLFHKMGY